MSSRLLFILIAVFVAALPAAGQPATSLLTSAGKRSSAAPDRSLIEGKVVFVQDGDTLNVKTRPDTIYQIRIQGIDAPEDGQKFGKEARKKLSDLVAGDDVTVVLHKKDAFGRSVGTVYRKGRDIGLEMIQAGLAWHFKTYAAEQTADDRKRYADAEAKARQDAVGLWSEKDPVPPWIHSGTVTNNDVNKPSAKAAVSTVPTSAPTTAPSTTSTGRKYLLGPRGGCYYIADDGRKVYVKDKSLCGQEPQVPAKP
ncbi:MAG TPA: thermonuclease family protein [Pyrinomonadaceae bacterium]|nr:thermonuclease family protein [Pyrinomonadaceae bacterium]